MHYPLSIIHCPFIIFRNDLLVNSAKDIVLYVLGVLSAIITPGVQLLLRLIPQQRK